MKNKLKFLLSIIVVALIALVLMPFLGKLMSKADSNAETAPTTTTTASEPILKDVSAFKNKIADTNKRELPPPEQLSGYGIRAFYEDGSYVKSNNLSYEGKPVKLYVSIANATPDKDKFGLMVFIDSDIVPYSVDDEKNEEYFYLQELPSFSLANIPITITPNPGISKGNHKIWFTFVNKLDEKKDESHSPLLNPLSLLKIISNENALNDKNIKTNGTVIPIRSDINQTNSFRMAIDYDIDINDLRQKVRLTVKKGDNAKFRIEAIGEPATYATLLFMNNKPVAFSKNEKAFLWKSEKDKMLSQRFEFKAPDKAGSYEMYALTMPLESENPFVKGSGKFTLEVIDK